ncbi:MAG TPA: PKD domain-containing protein, partial [Candidatus Thermoplasmatota archaeon]|nr:PKD domain-containing protein [Candidatus Thermoplasmatota archaeon]
MNALAKALLSVVALGALLLAVPAPAASQSPPTTAPSPLAFGMTAGAVAAQTAAGVKPEYGTFWIGPWTLSSGWGGPDGQMTAMKNAGVTPAIHHYYWGDDISQSCLENGCYSSLHKANKNKEGWQQLTDQLIVHLNSQMQGKPVLIFLETEFNKGSVATYEPLDGYLAEKAKQIKAGYPNAQVVMALGNWGQSSWGTWDRTAAASDFVGIQGMRGSTRQSATDYATLYEKTLEGAKVAQAKFAKPVFLQDIALSTYPEPQYLKLQTDEMKDFFAHTAELKAAGVKAIIYRSWVDTPTMDTANYYGEAERHWGLSWAGNNTLKPAGKVWVDGVKADRAGSSSATATPTTSTAPTAANRAPMAAFAASASGLAASVDGSASSDPDGQALTYAWTFGDGSSATGRTASHTYAAAGTYTVTLRASDGSLSSTASKAVTVSKPATATSTSSSSTPTKASTPYSASFTFGGGANEYWMEAKASASPAPAKVEVKVGSGAWTPLRQRDAMTWGESLHVAKGSWVSFRATAADGRTATTGQYAYMMSTSSMPASSSGTTSPPPTSSATASPTATATATPTASATRTSTSSTPTSATPTTSASSSDFKAYFTPRSVGSDYWVEVATMGNHPVVKVEAKVGSGTWVVLPKTTWGSYGQSVSAPNGSVVTFRATDGTGA